MGVENSPAIILDVFNLHEYDRIVTFLTPEAGKKKGVARGARRKYSRFAGQLQPFAKVEATWFEKEGRDLVRISSVELLGKPSTAVADLEDLLLRSYFADHMNAFAQENENSERLFRLLDSTLAALDQGISRALAARYYETWLLRLAGLLGEPGICPRCDRSFEELGAKLPRTGETILCSECAGSDGHRISAEASRVFVLMRKLSLHELAEVAISKELLEEIEDLAGRIRRTFLQQELKSYRVMRETLAGLPPALNQDG